MGESRALPGFGQVDLELESGLDVGAQGRVEREAREASEQVRAEAARREREREGDAPSSRVVPQRSVLPPPRMPPQARYVPNLTPKVTPRVSDRIASDPNAHATRRNMAATVAPAAASARVPTDGSTRIVRGDALADLLHGEPSPLPPEAYPTPVPAALPLARHAGEAGHESHDPHAPAHEPRTRAWSNVDEQLMAYQSMVPEADDEPPSAPSHPSRPSYGSGQTGPSARSRASGSGAGSGSGVAARDGRVAAMRELYARGDAEGALALAADISDSLHPGAMPGADGVVGVALPDASFGASFDATFDPGFPPDLGGGDPFGGLIPLDDDPRGPLPSFDSGVAGIAGGTDFELDVELDDRPQVDSGRGLVEHSTPRSHRDHHDHDAAASGQARRGREGRLVLPPLAPSPVTAAGAADADPPPLSLTERHSIPSMLVSMGEVAKLPIDHRAGFLLAHVDGMQTLEEILDVCAMPAAEALELIRKLEQMGVIAFE